MIDVLTRVSLPARKSEQARIASLGRGWAAIGLLLLYTVLLIATTRGTSGPPTLGLRIDLDEQLNIWRISSVHPLSPAADGGLRAGDLLISIDDELLTRETVNAENLARDAKRVTAIHPDTGEQLTADAVSRTPNRNALFVISAVFFFVGALALVWGRGRAPRALALVCFTGAAEAAVLPAIYRQLDWAFMLHSLFLPLFFASFAYLFLVFPTPRNPHILGRAIPKWIVPFSALPFAFAWSAVVLLAPDYYGLFQLLGAPYFLICLVGGAASLVYHWLKTHAPRERTQLRIVTYGSVLAILPFLLLTLVPQAVFGDDILSPRISILSLGLMPAAFGYAILRYQIMDLQFFIRRGLVYSALVAIITGIYALLLFTATLFVQNQTGVSNIIVVAIWGAIVALAAQPLRNVLQDRVDRLFDRQHYDYRQQLLEFSRRMSDVMDPEDLAQSTVELITQTMSPSFTRLYLFEPSTEGYRYWLGAGLPLDPNKELLAPQDAILSQLQHGGDITRVHNTSPDQETLLIVLKNKGQRIGLLTLGPKRSEFPYSSEDLSLLRTVGNQLAVATENTQLYGRMRDLYLSGIRTLAATVDAKDPYTHGHSERVAAYSRSIATALQLPSFDIETIELAGLLHDIGKIGIPDAVLQKPGRLEPAERAMIEEHAELGARILVDNLALMPLVPFVRHHHEWFNGKGYPDGLVGEDIPLGAAIISVADTFDTMTTNRPYRVAPGRSRAREEIARCSGTQFHPDVVSAFLSVVESEDFSVETYSPQTVVPTYYPMVGRMAMIDTRAKTIVYQVAQMIGEVTELEPFLNRVIELVRREIGIGNPELYLMDIQHGDLYRHSDATERIALLDNAIFRTSRDVVGWVARHRVPVRVDDIANDQRLRFGSNNDNGSLLVIPLILEGETLGAIYLESKRVAAYTPDDETLWLLVAGQLAQIIDVARLHDRLKQNALLDGLTGVSNHRYFYERLEAELDRTDSIPIPISIMLLDVDGLKLLNDTKGHVAGDAALRKIAEILREACQSSDVVARYGGDEFAMIFPGTNSLRAAQRAAQIELILHNSTFELNGQVIPLPTISWGIATSGVDGDRAVSLVAEADKRMYRNKARRAEKSGLAVPY